ncbi:aminopeptidase P family protein [Vibrio sp. S9_S30]|uniref:M24 family metallopeptidase n=1 Tax=Vibrio sp. S9_S30 TaxID=2720226 RepID=UPI00167FED5F|nr:Xaa-Pro peptidase family protein [Vibrio sp. S9_S30]MBD1559759.1 aminopeptidase P family protein [Vibrio sp. S9_S30]
MIYNHIQLKKQMIDNDIDIVVASTKENINYFTGYNPVVKTLNPYYGESYVVIFKDSTEKISVVVPVAEVDQVQDCKSNLLEVRTFGTFYREHCGAELSDEELELKDYSNTELSFETAASALLSLLETYRGGKHLNIAIDEDATPQKTRQLLASNENFTVEPLASLIRKVRVFKTEYEIEMLSESAKINERAIDSVLQNLEEGMSEEDIRVIFEIELVKHGAKPALTMVKIGRAAVGGQRTQKNHIKLKAGDLIWFDSDACYQGFWSDIARVYPYKEVTDRAEQIYSGLQKSMQSAVELIRPGMKASDVFHLMMEVAQKNGVPHYRRHHVGHGIGHEPYEMPILQPKDDTVIEVGMVLSIETPYYELGFGALHIEDPIYIGEHENRLLTSRPIPCLRVVK